MQEWKLPSSTIEVEKEFESEHVYAKMYRTELERRKRAESDLIKALDIINSDYIPKNNTIEMFLKTFK